MVGENEVVINHTINFQVLYTYPGSWRVRSKIRSRPVEKLEEVTYAVSVIVTARTTRQIVASGPGRVVGPGGL